MPDEGAWSRLVSSRLVLSYLLLSVYWLSAAIKYTAIVGTKVGVCEG